MDPAPLQGWEGEVIVPSYHVFRAEDEGIYTIDMSVDRTCSKLLPGPTGESASAKMSASA
jgi:hypothetical protein